jgi:hypothetical protein
MDTFFIKQKEGITLNKRRNFQSEPVVIISFYFVVVSQENQTKVLLHPPAYVIECQTSNARQCD